MCEAMTKDSMTTEQLGKLRGVKYYLLDMDGTIYLDTTLFDGTLDFLAELKKQGKKEFYITNNSSKGTADYKKKLERLGINCKEEDFCTSFHATVHHLNKVHPGAKLFVLGTDSLKGYFTENGFTLVEKYETETEKRPDYVVLAFDTNLTYDKLNAACFYIQDGVEYIATHPDNVCPYDGVHFMPDAGSFMKLIECSTGRVPSFIAGKPQPTMIKLIQEKMNCRDEEIAVVGDRLYTDIKSAVNAGVISICVLSGETSMKDIEESDFKPDYIFRSIKDIWEAIRGE